MEFGIRITADGRVAVTEVNRVKSEIKGVGEAARETGKNVSDMLAPLVAGLGAGAVVSNMVSVQREFDKINASLVTVTGSVANAEAAFGGLAAFASRTPYSLQEVAGAFIKLRALGLEPSERALESYGNTASAMGKSLNQMVEAVADATTGEMERLKEFGIKARQSGDQVSFTFQGVTKTVGNSASEIEAYLLGLGEVEFSGAMARQAETLNGAISNLGDSWSQLMLTIMRQGPGDLMYDGVKAASGALDDLSAIVRELGRNQDDAADASSRLGITQEGLRTVFEAVTIVGANVAYVFKAVGTEIGAIAAQMAALGRGDFAGFSAIGEAVKADAVAARAALDALEQRILNPSKAVAGSLDGLALSTKKAGAAAKEAKDEYGALMARLYGKSAGLDAGYFKDLETLHRQYKKTGDLEAYRHAVELLTTQQKFYTDAVAESEKAQKQWNDASARAAQESDRTLAGLEAKAGAMEDELRYYGMTEEAIQNCIIARLEERREAAAATDSQEEVVAALDREIAARKRIAAAAGSRDAIEANRRATDEMRRDWERFSDDINRSLTDALFRAFESGDSFGKAFATNLGNALKSMVLKFAIQQTMAMGGNVLNSGINAVLGTGGANSGGGVNYLGLASNASSLYNLASGSYLGYWQAAQAGYGLTSAEAANAAAAYYNAGYYGTGAAIQAGSAANGAAGAGSAAASSSWGTAGIYAAAAIIGYKIGEWLGGKMFGGGSSVSSSSGVRVGVSGGMATGSAYTDFHQHIDGGWFRSDKDYYWTKEAGLAIGDAFKGVRDLLTRLSIDTGKDLLAGIADFKASYSGSVDGLSGWLQSVADQMLMAALPGLDKFKQAGEDTAAAIARLGVLLSTIRTSSAAIDTQIGVLNGTYSGAALAMAQADAAYRALRESLAATSDIAARVEIEGQLAQAAQARYQTEKAWLTEINQTLTGAIRTVMGARSVLGESIASITGGSQRSPAELRAAIAGVMGGLDMPSIGGITAAAERYDQARAAEASLASLTRSNADYLNSVLADVSALYSLASRHGAAVNATAGGAYFSNDAYAYNAGTNRLGGFGQISYYTDNESSISAMKAGAEYRALVGRLDAANANLAGYEQQIAGVRAQLATLGDAAAAAMSLAAAQTAYSSAIADYVDDVGVGVERLQSLREETLAYYQAQQALAEQMSASSDAITQTLTDLRRAGQSPAVRYADLRSQFDSLRFGATSLTGAALAERADRLNALAMPMAEAAKAAFASRLEYDRAVGYVGGVLTDLRNRLDATAPRDYQAESVGLLSGIDAALSIIEGNLTSAEQQVVDAINASRDETVSVLRDIRGLLGGESANLPGHADGLDWVPYDNYKARLHRGEAVLTYEEAADWRSGRRYMPVSSGGNNDAALLSELRALRQSNEDMRAEVRAVVKHTADTKRALQRVMPDGDALSIRAVA